ncbi:hypothetical protein HF086_010711 [Spodoptera exigua]|uniref:Uncharacterized protein n=1 Tax=Spodoptera exigua TaxID=7107 RepID=A0A922M4V6_SPOEX|nr:hypothetical protein HF086_010711 [Spodoptera exigua]
MELAMQALFNDMLQKHAGTPPHRQLPEMLELKSAAPTAARPLLQRGPYCRARPLLQRGLLQELAKRFSVMFGLDAVKNREALTALHRAGIAFAALEQAGGSGPPPRLLFLEALAEFSGKLLRQDKRHVLRCLDARLGGALPGAGAGRADDWAALLAYRGSLLTDAPDDRPPPARRHYARRVRGQNEDEEGDDNVESDQEQPG